MSRHPRRVPQVPVGESNCSHEFNSKRRLSLSPKAGLLQRWLGLWILVFMGWEVRGDVPVWFGNLELSPSQLVYEPYRAQPLGRTSSQLYVAQLLYAIPTNYPPEWRAAGSHSLFAQQSSSASGTWASEARTLAGVGVGQHVVLSVLVWDLRKSANWRTALRDPVAVSGWQSEGFDFVYQSGPPSAQLIVNFPGGSLLGSDCRFVPPPPDAEIVCDENSTLLLFPQERVNWPGDFALQLRETAVVNYPTGLRIGHLTLMPFWEKGIRYNPRPNTYGEDWAYQYRHGGFCDPPRSTSTVLRIHVRPDPRRPFLVPASNGASQSLYLRGLADRRYRLEFSVDLREWMEVVRVTGNASEIDLSSELRTSDRDHFYRIVELIQ